MLLRITSNNDEIKCTFQEEDKEEMKEILEMKRTHDRLCKKRQNNVANKIVTPGDNVIL